MLDDPFAHLLVGPSWSALAERSGTGYPLEIQRQARAGIVVRARYAEDRLEAGDFAQYVLLGAGLDSVAWRRPDLLRRLRIVEVDHPASQAWKLERVRALGLPEDESHVFAAVDFEVQSLRDGLDAAGFDWNRPALFSWLGVTMYLTEDAIVATLATIATCHAGVRGRPHLRRTERRARRRRPPLRRAAAPTGRRLGRGAAGQAIPPGRGGARPTLRTADRRPTQPGRGRGALLRRTARRARPLHDAECLLTAAV